MPVFAVLRTQNTDVWNQILVQFLVEEKHSLSSRNSGFAHIQSCRSERSSPTLSPCLWLFGSGWRPASPGECRAQTWRPDEWGHPGVDRFGFTWWTDREQQDRNRAAESAAHSRSGGQSRSSAAGCTWRSHKYLYSSVPTGGDRVKQVDLSVFF